MKASFKIKRKEGKAISMYLWFQQSVWQYSRTSAKSLRSKYCATSGHKLDLQRSASVCMMFLEVCHRTRATARSAEVALISNSPGLSRQKRSLFWISD